MIHNIVCRNCEIMDVVITTCNFFYFTHMNLMGFRIILMIAYCLENLLLYIEYDSQCACSGHVWCSMSIVTVCVLFLLNFWPEEVDR